MRNRSAICQHQSNPLVIYLVLYKNEQAIPGSSNSLSYVDHLEARKKNGIGLYTIRHLSFFFSDNQEERKKKFFQLVVIHLVLYPNCLSLVSTEQWNDGTLMFASMFCLIYCFGIVMMAHKSKKREEEEGTLVAFYFRKSSSTSIFASIFNSKIYIDIQ